MQKGRLQWTVQPLPPDLLMWCINAMTTFIHIAFIITFNISSISIAIIYISNFFMDKLLNHRLGGLLWSEKPLIMCLIRQYIFNASDLFCF